MTHLLRIVVVCTYLVLATSLARATDRYYPNQTATSPDGRFTVQATSPHNAGPRSRPFASNFEYSLTDTKTNKVLWKRTQPMARSKGSPNGYPEESSPTQLFVHDSGVVVAALAYETLLVLDAKTGRKKVEAPVLEAFPKDQLDQFVRESTAGPIWRQRSDWFFLSVPGSDANKPTLYFVVRPYWGHRLIIDTDSGKHVGLGAFHNANDTTQLDALPEPAKSVLIACLAEESRRAIDSLRAHITSIDADHTWTDDRWPETRSLSVALQCIQSRRLKEAEPLLKRLEELLIRHEKLPDAFRLHTRQALRAIGAVPQPGYGVRLYPMRKDKSYYFSDTDNPYRGSVPLADRIANVDKVKVGMTVAQFAELLGSPDAEVYEIGRSYDYDIDAPEPFTLRIALDQEQEKIKGVRKIPGFAFLTDPARMRE